MDYLLLSFVVMFGITLLISVASWAFKTCISYKAKLGYRLSVLFSSREENGLSPGVVRVSNASAKEANDSLKTAILDDICCRLRKSSLILQKEHMLQSLAELQQQNGSAESSMPSDGESAGDCEMHTGAGSVDIETGTDGITKGCDEARAQQYTHIAIPCPGSNDAESRRVPAFCAICLNQYQLGEEISWCSTNADCPHVFHKECASWWFATLVMKNGGRAKLECPMCRQEFLKARDMDATKNSEKLLVTPFEL